MTEEQIEDVTLGIAAAMIDPSEDAVELALWRLRRLLEERKRLLAGIREAMGLLELEGDHVEAAWLALKEARAFAEEPAR